MAPRQRSFFGPDLNPYKLPDGLYTLSVTATDAAGNPSLAGIATYQLDTTDPLPAVVGLASATRSNNDSPLWIWQFAFADQATALDSATCTVTGPGGWTSTTQDCPHHFQTQLLGGDGNYTLRVTLTDEAGNTSVSTPSTYILDSTAPAGPTVYLLHPASGAGLDRHPVWSVSGPPDTTLMCTLVRGTKSGTVVWPKAVCPDPATFSLVGMPDGMYTLVVVTVDAAGNISPSASWPYVLVPPAPRVRPPTSESATAVWSIIGNPSDKFQCTLLRGSRVISTARPCPANPQYDMTKEPAGGYTLSVVQVGAEGVASAPGSGNWFWDGVAPRLPGGPPPGSRGHHPAGPPVTKRPSNTTPLTRLPALIRKQLQKLGHAVGSIPVIYPVVHPNRVTAAVSSAVQGVVHAVGAAGGGTGFPLLLIGLVMIFLLVQNRIDRRDPKLALASIAADDTVEFQPPPSRRDRP